MDQDTADKRASRKYSISSAIATSLGINPSGNSSPNSSAFDITGRSYVYGSFKQSNNFLQPSSSFFHTGNSVHEQTANLANIGISDDLNDSEDVGSPGIPSHSIPISGTYPSTLAASPSFSENAIIDDNTPLLGNRKTLQYPESDEYLLQPVNYLTPSSSPSPNVDIESGAVSLPSKLRTIVTESKKNILTPIGYLPAVFLGTLLNILDGLSYGMIMFPIGEAVFSNLAPAGLSMFYVSCIISQLIYSSGFSAFKSGIGSEMIEVTPFFHSMATSIMMELGGESGDKDAIIATTIVTYAISSVVTGLVFFLLGKCKLGALVGFFPRHILVGCIGGVGYFLVVTGIEVSSRLEGGLEYNWEVLKYLLQPLQFLQWTLPLVLTVALVALQHHVHNSLIVPSFFIGVFLAFHVVVAAVPGWNLEMARASGWVFQAVDGKEPWYGFYELYKFDLVDWWCILKQTPSMLALTFFGILHVPINVPALAVTVGMDQVDVDKELVAHGYSNAISGLFGSIQNYLVYTNSVLFIRAGADSRVAGFMLAIATAAVMCAGPVVIGYIPIYVVGALIYLLGYELIKEALFDTYGKLKKIEYGTVFCIVIVMGAWDFVYGVLVGILLACLSFVVEAAKRPAVSGMYTGSSARSTVLRHPKQQEFLRDVGDQICVVKLQGTVFFGSIGGLEKTIRSRFEPENFTADPVRFLILDMKSVPSIDFSAAEGFRRIQNLMNECNTQLIISSVSEKGPIIKALRDAGLWDNEHILQIQLFNTLNSALEWCENSFLKTYKDIKQKEHLSIQTSSATTAYKKKIGNIGPMSFLDGAVGSPRQAHVLKVATKTVRDEQQIQTNIPLKFQQPLPLMMTTFQGLSKQNSSFWSNVAPYFIKETIPQDTTFYQTQDGKSGFFLVESGLVRSILKFGKTGEISSSILPLTAFGDLTDGTNSKRDVIYQTVNDSIIWRLDENRLQELSKVEGGVLILNELLKIQIKLGSERFDTMTANLLISS